MSGPALAWRAPRLGRRAVLAGALAAAATAALVALQPGARRTPRTALRVLDIDTFSTLAAIADRVCPAIPGSPGLPDAWTLRVPERVDEALAGMHPATAAEVIAALRLMESGLVGLVDGRIRPLSRCDPDTQDRVLHRWRTSRIGVRRSAFLGVTGLVSAAYWSCPEVFASIGYPGPPRFGP